MDGELGVSLFPQTDGSVHVLLTNLVLGNGPDPLPKLLTALAQQHGLVPERTLWFERWHMMGWGRLQAAWRDGRCVRVDWKPINSSEAPVLVQGSSDKVVPAVELRGQL